MPIITDCWGKFSKEGDNHCVKPLNNFAVIKNKKKRGKQNKQKNKHEDETAAKGHLSQPSRTIN